MPGPYAPTDYTSDTLPGAFPGATAPLNRYKEWFSWSVVASTASASGLVCQTPMIDANKVDVRIETWGAWQGKVRSIGLQLKATANPSFVGPPHDRQLAFSLDGPDYNELVAACSYERFLVVVALPPAGKTWVRQRPSMQALSAAAWWGKVTGPPTNQGTKTVHIPVSQRFDVDGLQVMLAAA